MSDTASSSSLRPGPERPVVSSPPDHRPGSASLQSLLHPTDDAPAPTAGPEAEKHPKGKRKRTAAKDKMILEDAYKSNPKPDKQARLQIVDRVSLNEKEVQIWFQNRRQNDRRRSRPLSPEELAALKYSGLHGISSDPASARGLNPESDKPYPSSDPVAAWPADLHSGSPPYHRTSPEQSKPYIDVATPRQEPQETGAQAQPGQTPLHGEEAPSSQQSQAPDSTSYSFSSSVGYLANRWNLGSSFSTPCSSGAAGDDSPRPESLPPSSCSSDTTRNANRSQSGVRLSLSLEGKAELVSNQASPARNAPLRPSSALSGPMPARRTGLQRSHSAIPTLTLPPISTLTDLLPPRLIRGRSRDVHAWESCADSERRDELTAQAEHESNGSAIAAISLLRSSSAVLQSSSTKRNASLTRPQQPRQTKRAKFGRTNSTQARIENVEADLDKPRRSLNGKVKVAMLVSPNDSDKENWSPDEDANPDRQRRRPLPSDPPVKSQNNRRQGRVLQEQKRPALLGNRAHTAPSGPKGFSKGGIDIYEDSEKQRLRDDDVARFMSGQVSPSKKGDMDCIAGLLSLSQGAWR